MFVEERVQVKLVELVITARETVPENPFRGLIMIAELLAVPTGLVTVVGLAEMAKSAAAVT
jgi:hypothetical protein